MDSLVHSKEKVYFGISLVVSILVYSLLIFSVVGILYLLLGLVLGLVFHGLFIGNLKGNGILVSEWQFPEVHKIASQLATEMELKELPPIYVLQAGGMLNAFATKFLGSSFVVIYSDVLELAYEEGGDELAFVICHELAHLKRRHPTWRLILYPSMMVPFLGAAYSRACEYTCDSFGAYYVPKGAESGLLVLAAGKKLYRSVNVDSYLRQVRSADGFWVWFSEVVSSHPNLTKRIKALKQGTAQRTYDDLMVKSGNA